MLPAKIKGLNRDASDDSNEEEVENPITKEALEQRTQQSYREALILQKQNKLGEAKTLLRDLLQSEVLVEMTGKVKFVNGRLQPSLFHLKYCCYLNLGNILTKSKEYDSALDNYLKATELDDTDLNLWFKIGTVAMQIPNLTYAIEAYTETLRRNPRHWPSIDAIITATYVTGNLMACLLFISHSLNLDPSFSKGLILKDRIFQEHPFLKRDFEIFYPDRFNYLNVQTIIYDEEEVEKVLTELHQLKIKDVHSKLISEDSEREINLLQEMLKPLKNQTWLCLGNLLLKLYKFLFANVNDKLFFSSINLSEVLLNNNDFCGESSKLLITPGENEKETEKETGFGVANSFIPVLSEDENEMLSELASISAKSCEPEKEIVDGGSKAKRRKCSPTLADQLKICDKRRSTRNKTILKSNEPSLSKTLQQLISTDLLPQKDKLSASNFYDLLRWNEDSFDTMDIYRLLFEHQEQNNLLSYPVNELTETTRTKLVREENYFNTDKEIKHISWFIQINNERMILELLDAFLGELGSKWRYTWPEKLADIFVEIYEILWKHGFGKTRLNISDNCGSKFVVVDESSYSLAENINIVLLYGELLLNQCFDSDSGEQPLGNCALGGKFSSLLIGDLHDACFSLNCSENRMKSLMRTYWLEALIFLLKKDTFATCSALSTLIEQFPDSNIEIKLPNLKQFHIISLSDAKKLLNTLCRNQNLSEVKPLLSEKQFDRVIEILQETLKPDCKQLVHLPNETTLSRYEQYNLLLEALWESKSYSELFEWCEVSCYEAFAVYRKSFFDEVETDAKSKWASLVTNAVNCMLCCLQIVDLSIVRTLQSERLSRLVQTLSNLICHQIEASEPCPEIISDVVTPWILLANLIEYNEKCSSEASAEAVVELVIPSFLSLMFIAHEHLGRRSWCCFNDGALLFYLLNVIEPLYKNCATSSELWTTLSQQVDQIFYCLYSHPFKKNKPRHVQDHNSLGLALTWNRAVQAYSFYRPSILPMFDAGSKYCTISGDTETLLKRMVLLVPEDKNPTRFVDSVRRYLNGALPFIPENDCQLSTDVVDLYYLLGDYYFKNKIMDKAIKYYLLDICWNPRRVDSWSAMALARGSQLEMKLNSCETITSECDILKKAELTDKCYKTALELDFNQSTLWIEYGVFSYAIHAFCSRLLKQETTNLSLQMFDMLETRKEEFLKTSQRCFNSANDAWFELTSRQEDVQDERWLHHYMLGKIGEKREEKVEICLKHYFEAFHLLHQNGAEYPLRILYSSPQYYSVEALEVYYRVHASILKILEAHEEKPLDIASIESIKMYIDKMAYSPFATTRARSMLTKLNDKSSRDQALVKSNTAIRESIYEVREIVDEMIAKVVHQTSERAVPKRKTTEFLLPDDDCVIKKSRANSEDSLVGENEHSDKSDEGRLTAGSTDDEDNKSRMRTDISRTDSSSPDLPSRDVSSDSSSCDSSSVSSHFAYDTDKEFENKMFENKVAASNRLDWQKTRKLLIDTCVNALEECVRRFPEHYKSFYRLSQHYFRSKLDKDISKARKLLIEEGGLFADRTNKNFFGGIWRIPTAEIDRPGSFAFHMSRSIHLLMDILRDTQDYKTLLQLSNQLRYKPDLDKKYLRDNEREQLCKDALILSAQALRKQIDHMSAFEDEPTKRRLLLDVYNTYLRVSKKYSQKDNSFSKLLTAAYYKYTMRKEKTGMEDILTLCKTVDQVAKTEYALKNATSILEAISSSENSVFASSVSSQAVSEVKCQSIISSTVDSKVPALLKQKSSSISFTPSIPSNLKNLPPAITVTTVPSKTKVSSLSQLCEKNFTSQIATSSMTKSRQCIIIRTGASTKYKVKSNKNEFAKAKRASMAPSDASFDVECSLPMKLSLIERKTCKIRTLVENTIEHSVSTDNGLTIVPVLTDDAHSSTTCVSTPGFSQVTTPTSTNKISPTGTKTSKHLPPDLTSVGKERPSLIITPVSSKGPTLQQKLAAKQMANNSNARSQLSNSSNVFSKSTCGRNSFNPLDVSKQLGASGVSIFPLKVDSSVHSGVGANSGVNLNRYVYRENEILSHFQSKNSFPTVTQPQSNSSVSKQTSRVPASSSFSPSRSNLVKSKIAKKTEIIDFNNLKTCNQGLIIEQNSKIKSLPELKIKSLSRVSEEERGFNIPMENVKKSSLDVILDQC